MNTIDDSLLNKELNSKIGIGNNRYPNFLDCQIYLGNYIINRLKDQHALINQFYLTVSRIGKLALLGEMKPFVKAILFSESILGLDIHYHENLDEFAWNPPLYYRTDQSINGKIFEIQAPGSGWGDLPLMANMLSQLRCNIDQNLAISFVRKYVNSLKKLTNKDFPHVGHFLDASSNPISMRYLLAISQNEIGYWGMNSNVTMDNLDCVITHSVSSITTLNFYQKYYEKAKNKELVFALPPNLIFDQKSIYLLPFIEETKSFFSDDIRQLFPYTTYINNDGFELENGYHISIDEFSTLPSSKRKYYLKYGGPNTNKNWGSRDVYRLNKNDCRKLLSMANELSKNGEIWIIQSDITSLSDNVNSNYSNSINQIIADGNHIKLSAFYTPYDYLGCKVMFRKHFKVHGQLDTYTGIGI